MTNYSKAFEHFLAHCDQRKHLFNWFKQEAARFKNVNSVLSLGTGTGVCEMEILKHAPMVKSIVAVEPESTFCMSLTKNLSQYCSDVTIYASKLDECRDKVFSQTYDLIIMSHFLYYVSDRKELLKTAYDSLNPGGFILVVNETEEGIAAVRLHYDRSKRFVFTSKDVMDILPATASIFQLEGSVPSIHIRQMMPFILVNENVAEAECDDAMQFITTRYGDIMPQMSAVFIIQQQN